MIDDVVLLKFDSIERCVSQIRNYYKIENEVPLERDFLKQDAINMNLQRACEQCLDVANHLVSQLKSGVPRSSRESFRILYENGLISEDTLGRMEKMIGFRNFLIHEYQKELIGILKEIIENHLKDFSDFIVEIKNNSPD